MLKELMEATTPREFMSASRLFASSEGRLSFTQELLNENIVLSADDMLTPEEVDACVRTEDSINAALAASEQENIPKCVVHRLQILGGCNPGIQRFVDSFLKRACL